MPVQRTLFGRPIPRIPPRRITLLLGFVAVFAVITLIFTLPSSVPTGPSLSKFTDTHHIPIPNIATKLSSPSILNPFRATAHAPPVQKNSTSGDSSWYSDWNWLSPFSSSVTLDENRSLLPPLLERPPIYTYYDHKLKKDSDTRSAENEILVTWRRAWWAQGFKPIILGPAEATNNPLYQEMQTLKLEEELQAELSRWLAWDNMGAGILCHYLTLPMGSHEDSLLSFLRRGEYPKLSRYEGLGNGLFCGMKADITAAIHAALSSLELSKVKDLVEAVPAETFEVEPQPEAIAFYDPLTVKTKYKKVDEVIQESGSKGLHRLNQLMNAHLHNTWQNLFSDGIAVLKPLRNHMTAVLEPAREFAEFLAQCPESPILSSCPPNRPKCNPCVSSTPLKISTPPYYRNTSALYTIGVVPHPYTLASLEGFRENLDISYIRRKTDRDPWIDTMTKELLGTGVSSGARVVKFKEAVASPHGTAHSIWFTAERPLPNDLDWYFGFTVPQNTTDNGKSETPVPGPERRPPPKDRNPLDGPVPSADDLKRERELLDQAKIIRKSKEPGQVKIREAVEAWNLADMEAWRFARAFLARNRVERLKWEEEEKKFAGGAGAERAGNEGWGRWFDS